jgi:hypothetical protein
MNQLKDYSRLYPKMPIEILLYFSQTQNERFGLYKVQGFCIYYNQKYSPKEPPTQESFLE